jgi:hypothetical protein
MFAFPGERASPDVLFGDQCPCCATRAWRAFTCTSDRSGLSTGVDRFFAQGLEWSSRPSDRLSDELVPQTIGFLERSKAIKDGERLLCARCGVRVVTREPSGAA